MVVVTFKYTWRVQPDGVGVIEERSSLTDRIVETRINARDRAIVRVLESMGWASPDRHAQLVGAVERISKRASVAECKQVPCSPIQRLFVDIMQQADDALAAHRKQGGK